MNDQDRRTSALLSRRTLLKGAGAGVAGMTLAHAGLIRSLAAESESVQRVLDVTATIERFGVTFLGAGIDSAERKNFTNPIPTAVLDVVKAARAQEQFHLDFFERAGGRPLVGTFTIPPAALTDHDTFFKAIVVQETTEVAAQIAAIRVYAEHKRFDLVKASFQYAAEEAEHRLVAASALQASPPNDRAFAPMLFSTVGEALTSLKQRGLIGGSGRPIAFPGPGRINAHNVINRTPGGVAVPMAGQ
jgi:hypothetical protein